MWRFKYLVLAGCAVGLLLSILTIDKIDFSHGAPHLTPRTMPIYGSAATLFVTEAGFPWGSATQPYSTGPGGAPVPAGDIGRLTNLAGLYVQLANSDQLRVLVARHSPPGGSIAATQQYSFSPSFYSSATPLIIISGTGRSGANAVATTQAGVNALTSYIEGQQRSAGIDPARRVLIQELQRPRGAKVVNAPKKTLPIVVFLTVMLAVTGLAFALENLRPRMLGAVALKSEPEPLLDSTRRSA
jgi:hypothetical protein